MKKIREDHSNSDDHDYQEEEDVSLCDLPLLSLMKDEEENDKKGVLLKEYDTKDDVVYTETQEEFAFGTSIGDGSLSTVSEMCAADEVFFRGQILPLRLSVSSDVGPTRTDLPRKFGSRSESMDHGSLGGFRSISSRSSSCSSRSTQHSSSSTATITITRVTSEPRLRNLNQFHGHPSPKPQIRVSSARLERLGSTNRKHKSSMWDFFRLGLVRTPDIELQEVNKVNFIRSNSRPNHNNNKGSSSSPPSVSRNSSVNNSDNSNINSSLMNNNMNSISTTFNGENNANGAVLSVEEKQKRRKFLSGCKCSVDTVASNVIMVKSKGTTTTSPGSTSGAKHGMKKEKVVLVQELKTTSSSKKNNQNQNKLDHKQKQQRQKQEGSRKQAMSQHRTYEWLKELSHANLPMHV